MSSILPVHPAEQQLLPCSAPPALLCLTDPQRICGCKGEAGHAGVLALALEKGEEQLLKRTVHNAVIKYIT